MIAKTKTLRNKHSQTDEDCALIEKLGGDNINVILSAGPSDDQHYVIREWPSSDIAQKWVDYMLTKADCGSSIILAE
jgi:hypothetical protein